MTRLRDLVVELGKEEERSIKNKGVGGNASMRRVPGIYRQERQTASENEVIARGIERADTKKTKG
jgi:hypothetical protein